MRKFIKKKYAFSILVIISIFIANIIISATTGANVLSNTLSYVKNKLAPNKEEIKSIELSSDGYNDNTSGSYKIDKSAKWTGTNTAQIQFNVDTVKKKSDVKKDVILVLDTSDSMYSYKLNNIKKNATEFVELLLSDSGNRVALITFNTYSKIEYDLICDKLKLIDRIDRLIALGSTNYNQALINVNKLLTSYEKTDDRELIVLFLTDGIPNTEIHNQVAQYKLLKEKYPYMTINGIQYEMGMEIIPAIENISDNQYLAYTDNLLDIFVDASDVSETYEKFELVDYIDDEHFYVESVDDIVVSIGKVTLVEEKGIQKVIWTVEPNEFRTGSSANMTINVKLKEQYVGTEGYYPTNKKFEVTTKLLNEKEVKQTTDKTPILKSGYKVYYDANAPASCDADNFEEIHYAFENVKISDKELNCTGYSFKGWKITDEVNKLNNDYFTMLNHDVHVKAIWTKQEIIKSMDGTIYEVPPSVMKTYSYSSSDDYHNSKYKRKVTSIVFKNNTDIPSTAIEYWDVSEDNNGSVMAYIEDDGTGKGTYKVTIGGINKVVANPDSSSLFQGFTNLKEIDFKYFDTSNVTNMNAMFYDCNGLTALDLSNFDTSNVTSMRSMFENCRNLQSLDLKSFTTSNVTDMYYMFSDCASLKTLDLNDFDTSNVTNMAFMFWGCRGFETLDLSSFDTSNVINMRAMFSDCSNLTTLKLNNFNTKKVIDMSDMFMRCNNLNKLDLHTFDTSNVTSMEHMFTSCTNLESLDLSSFDIHNVTNMNGMFSNCSNLEVLDLKNFDTSKVNNMDSMFSFCNKLVTTIDIKNDNVDYDYMFSGAATASGAKITVNYTNDNSDLVDSMIATKSADSHVIKGRLITN